MVPCAGIAFIVEGVRLHGGRVVGGMCVRRAFAAEAFPAWPGHQKPDRLDFRYDGDSLRGRHQRHPPGEESEVCAFSRQKERQKAGGYFPQGYSLGHRPALQVPRLQSQQTYHHRRGPRSSLSRRTPLSRR